VLGGTSCDCASGYWCWARQEASLGFLLSVAECLISVKIQHRMFAISRRHTKRTQCSAPINQPEYWMSQQLVSCSRNSPLLWKLWARPVLLGRKITSKISATYLTIYQLIRRNIPEDSYRHHNRCGTANLEKLKVRGLPKRTHQWTPSERMNSVLSS